MKGLLKKGQIFSFLAYANEMQLHSSKLQEIKNIYISVLNMGFSGQTSNLKFALLLPYKKIGKYASSVTNAVFAYLMTRNYPFVIKSFMIDSEELQDIKTALSKIQKEGFSYVIAPLTTEGANNLISLSPHLKVFFPTIHKNDFSSSTNNFYFGAIDYKAQSAALLKHAIDTLAIFYDNSAMGRKLTQIDEELFLQKSTSEANVNNAAKRIYKFAVASRTTNLEHRLKNNKKLDNATVVLNTPLIKSGMIMSQLTLYDINTSSILSTQINYDPLIFSITQYEDRKNMLITDSITNTKKIFTYTNALLKNDIRYDWINYSTTVGIDYFFSLITHLPREYDIEITQNQFRYPIKLVRPGISKFIDYEAP